MTESTIAETPTTKRRRRVSSPRIETLIERERVTLHLMPAAAKRLKLNALDSGRDRGEIVSQLINEHTRNLVLSDRTRSGASESESVA